MQLQCRCVAECRFIYHGGQRSSEINSPKGNLLNFKISTCCLQNKLDQCFGSQNNTTSCMCSQPLLRRVKNAQCQTWGHTYFAHSFFTPYFGRSLSCPQTIVEPANENNSHRTWLRTKGVGSDNNQTFTLTSGFLKFAFNQLDLILISAGLSCDK